MMQGPTSKGINAPAQVEQGQPVEIQVGADGVDTVLVSDGSGSKPQEYPVGPGGKVTIPSSPTWQPGTLLTLYTNTTPLRTVVVEVTPPQI